MRRGNFGSVQNCAVASETYQQVRIVNFVVQIPELEIFRQLIIPVHIERQTQGGLNAAAFQYFFCLLNCAELLVPVGIRGQNDFHFDHPFSAACACVTKSPGAV